MPKFLSFDHFFHLNNNIVNDNTNCPIHTTHTKAHSLSTFCTEKFANMILNTLSNINRHIYLASINLKGSGFGKIRFRGTVDNSHDLKIYRLCVQVSNGPNPSYYPAMGNQ